MDSSFSSSSGIVGEPLQIVDISDHKLKLNEENLKKILNHPNASSKKVKKKFFKCINLNFILR